MTVIEDLALELDPGRAVRRLRLDRMPDPTTRAREFIDRVLGLAEPRAVFASRPVGDRGPDWVEVDGVLLRSAVLARHTRGAGRVYPYVVTLGSRVDEAVAGAGTLLEQYCLHETANLVLAQAREEVRRRVARASGLPALYSLAPGSLADWPLTEQRALFGLLGDVEETLGVRLTEACLMVPRKTLSGLLFPSDRPFVSCRLCDSPDCPARQAPFAPGPSRHDVHG